MWRKGGREETRRDERRLEETREVDKMGKREGGSEANAQPLAACSEDRRGDGRERVFECRRCRASRPMEPIVVGKSAAANPSCAPFCVCFMPLTRGKSRWVGRRVRSTRMQVIFGESGDGDRNRKQRGCDITRWLRLVLFVSLFVCLLLVCLFSLFPFFSSVSLLPFASLSLYFVLPLSDNPDGVSVCTFVLSRTSRGGGEKSQTMPRKPQKGP